MNMPIVQKIEICFWDVVIHLLSNSTFVRNLVQFVSRHTTKRDLLSGFAMITAGGIAGLMLGFVVPMLLNAVR